MTSYACMPNTQLADGLFSICAVQANHIEQIRQWRNAQRDILRQTAEITPEMQEAYFEQNIWPDMQSPEPENILVAFLEDQVLIGYGGLVHISWEHLRAEVSFLLNPELTHNRHKYAEYFSTFLSMLKALAFDDLGLERLFTETYSLRKDHISVLKDSGFRREGVLERHIRINNQFVNSVIHGCLRTYERDEDD